MFGKLLLPTNAPAPFPAIVLLHGSDRGELTDYEHIALRLNESGFAILYYDSPGKGKSTGTSFGETFKDRTYEAISAVKYLQSRDDIIPSQIGLWGISQGGWICQSAAATSDQIAFIITVSGPGVTLLEQEIYRIRNLSKESGLLEIDIKKAVLMRCLFTDIVFSNPVYKDENIENAKSLGAGVWNDLIELAYSEERPDPDTELKSLLSALRQIVNEPWAEHLMIDQMIPALESMNGDAWNLSKPVFESTLNFDPKEYLPKINIPILALFGELDRTVPIEESIRRYKEYTKISENKNLSIKVFPKADHGLAVNGKLAKGYYSTMLRWLTRLKLD